METFLNYFYETGEISNVLACLDLCVKNEQCPQNGRSQGYSLGLEIGEYFKEIFPNNARILKNYAVCALYEKKEEIAFDIFFRLKDPRWKLALPVVKTTVEVYPKEKVDSLCSRKPRSTKVVTLTMTTCKRLDLFRRTVNSFLNCCTDLDRVDAFICVDDNSSEEDRECMKKEYPFFEFIFKTSEKKGHAKSMNILRERIQSPYFFHMEDDFLFFHKSDYITKCLEVLSENPRYGQCLINKNYAETEKEDIIGGYVKETQSGQEYVLHEHTRSAQEQTAFSLKYGNKPNCAYWPHFSFRPGITKTSVLKVIGKYAENNPYFEREYADKYTSLGYLTTFLNGTFCLHIGRLTSERYSDKENAYTLNGENQFDAKNDGKDSFCEFQVINLDRRRDRWERFLKDCPAGMKVNRFSAVDGNTIIPSERLQRIFCGNDYNMRKGIVGCALSHIQLYIDLLKSKREYFCILEDDVILSPNFLKQYEKLLIRLKEIPEWDLCYLGHHLWPKYITSETYSPDQEVMIERWDTKMSLEKSIGGTGGYLISRKGAESMLQFFENTGMLQAVDTMQQRSADTLCVLYCHPHIIFAECANTSGVDTDIQYNFMSLSIPLEERKKNYATALGLYGPVKTGIPDGSIGIFLSTTSENAEGYIISQISKGEYIYVHNSLQVPKDLYLTRIRKENGEWNISELVKKRCVSISSITHVSEALAHSDNFPFDKIDGGEICDYFSYYMQGDVSGYVNNDKGIGFPHEDKNSLHFLYMKKFENLNTLLLSGNPITFIYATRNEPIPEVGKKNDNILLELLNKFPQVEILSVNATKLEHPRLHLKTLKFENQDDTWTNEKIVYDQNVFRVGLEKIISSFIAQ